MADLIAAVICSTVWLWVHRSCIVDRVAYCGHLCIAGLRGSR